MSELTEMITAWSEVPLEVLMLGILGWIVWRQTKMESALTRIAGKVGGHESKIDGVIDEVNALRSELCDTRVQLSRILGILEGMGHQGSSEHPFPRTTIGQSVVESAESNETSTGTNGKQEPES